MYDLILKNADVVLITGPVKKDIAILGDRIVNISDHIEGENAIDLSGKIIFPGAIDAHVHFREPGPTYKEDFKSGSRAAVFGGVTTVLEMPNTWPTTTDLEALESKRQIAKDTSVCNYGLFFGATPSNLEIAKQAKGIPGLKIFMGCSTGDLLVYKEEDLEKIFATYEGRICVHAEWEPRLKERSETFRESTDLSIHSKIRDTECAVEAIRHAGLLAAKYGRHLHILHLSSKAELETIQEIKNLEHFKESGAKITCEVCPHHLFFSTEDYPRLGNLIKMNPPVRDSEDVKAMWHGLKMGAIQMVATDHAPHTWEEKSGSYWDVPSGVPAVELMLPLLLDASVHSRCTYVEIANWLSHHPAEVYKIVDRGVIKEGYFADLVVVDTLEEILVENHTQKTKCAWSPWAGSILQGKPIMTIINGKVVMNHGELILENVGTEVRFEDL